MPSRISTFGKTDAGRKTAGYVLASAYALVTGSAVVVRDTDRANQRCGCLKAVSISQASGPLNWSFRMSLVLNVRLSGAIANGFNSGSV